MQILQPRRKGTSKHIHLLFDETSIGKGGLTRTLLRQGGPNRQDWIGLVVIAKEIHLTMADASNPDRALERQISLTNDRSEFRMRDSMSLTPILKGRPRTTKTSTAKKLPAKQTKAINKAQIAGARAVFGVPGKGSGKSSAGVPKGGTKPSKGGGKVPHPGTVKSSSGCAKQTSAKGKVSALSARISKRTLIVEVQAPILDSSQSDTRAAKRIRQK